MAMQKTLALRCIQKLLLVAIIVFFFLHTLNAHTVRMDYLPFLLLCLRFWFVDPRWSRAEFVLTSSLLMSDSKPKLSYIIQGVFIFSPKHFTIALYLCMLHDSRSRFRGRSMIQCCIYIFFLIVDSKWHLWDTLIKQFFLLLRPA